MIRPVHAALWYFTLERQLCKILAGSYKFPGTAERCETRFFLERGNYLRSSVAAGVILLFV